METGFRRLWRRKRGKDTGDSSRAASSNDFTRLELSLNHEGRASATIPRQVESKSGQDKFSNGNYLSIASSELSQTKSGNRIQPILIGISRPGDFAHRPATAVSLNTAVQRAADTARGPQDQHKNQISSISGHKRTPSGRSVDIFRVTGKLKGYKSRFNEEIAERNLDTLRAAAAESVPSYVPTSKYQEEVADRNASRPYSSRGSVDNERTGSLTRRSLRSPSNPLTTGAPADQIQGDHVRLMPKGLPDRTVHYLRQTSIRSRDGTPALPPIPQERTSDKDADDLDKSVPLTNGRIINKPDNANLVHQSGLGRHSASQRPKSSGRDQPLYAQAQQGGVDTAFQPIDEIEDLVSDNEPAPAPPSRHPGRVGVSRNTASETSTANRNPVDPSTRSPSLLSSSSNKRNSSNTGRRVLDLTNEDVYSETSSTYGYSQYSPILEQANTGRFERSSQLPHAYSYSTVTVTGTAPNLSASQRLSHSFEPDYKKVEERDEVDQAQRQSKQNPTAQVTSQITFSPINTLASLAPHVNLLAQQDVLLASSTREPQEVIVSSTEASSKVRVNPKIQRDESMSKVQRAAAALEARSASQSPKPGVSPAADSAKRKSFVPVKENQHQITGRRETAPLVAPQETVDPDVTVKVIDYADMPRSKGDVMQRRNESDSLQSKQSKSRLNAQSAASIHDSPSSLRSEDFTDPSAAFGVRTRDFAITPRNSASSMRKKSNPQILQRTATENALKAVNDARKLEASTEVKKALRERSKSRTKRSISAAAYKPAKSEFDEEAFARKQAEAKAALIRLQESLQEDFIKLPAPIPPKKLPKHADNDSSPVAPTSIIYPQSILNQPQSRHTTSNSLEQNHDSVKPPSSYRSPSAPLGRELSSSTSPSRSEVSSTRKAAPPSLENVEAASKPVNQALLPPALQQLLLQSSQPPRSPGEISLSSFPLPSSRPGSQHENAASISRPIGYSHLRRNSNRSQTSVASQYSIPAQMIPDRSSSFRDTVTEEDEEYYYS